MSNGFVGKAKEHYSAEEDAVRYVQGYNVKPNRIDYTGMKRVSRQFHTRERKTSLCSGDILTVQTGDIGVSVCVPPDLDGANCHALIITRLKPTWGVCGFYVQYLNSARGSTGIMEISTGSTMKHVNAGDMRKLVVPLPPLPEQQRIAEILATWDEALTQTRQLRDAARDRKRALMQQLLTGKLRIAGLGEPASTRSRYPSDWRTLRASELFVRYSRRDGGALPVLAVTQGEGVVPRSSLDRRIEATEESVAGYKVVEAGSFVISLRSFEGGLEYSPYDGVVSPAYHVIKPTAIATAEYYRHYFKSCDFVGRLATSVSCSCRAPRLPSSAPLPTCWPRPTPKSACWVISSPPSTNRSAASCRNS
jgi:type I restriction enzyme S subunit